MHICHDSAHPEQESSVFTLLAHRLEPLHAHLQLQQNCSDTTWNLLMAGGGAPGGVRATAQAGAAGGAYAGGGAYQIFIAGKSRSKFRLNHNPRSAAARACPKTRMELRILLRSTTQFGGPDPGFGPLHASASDLYPLRQRAAEMLGVGCVWGNAVAATG